MLANIHNVLASYRGLILGVQWRVLACRRWRSTRCMPPFGLATVPLAEHNVSGFAALIRRHDGALARDASSVSARDPRRPRDGIVAGRGHALAADCAPQRCARSRRDRSHATAPASPARLTLRTLPSFAGQRRRCTGRRGQRSGAARRVSFTRRLSRQPNSFSLRRSDAAASAAIQRQPRLRLPSRGRTRAPRAARPAVFSRRGVARLRGASPP